MFLYLSIIRCWWITSNILSGVCGVCTLDWTATPHIHYLPRSWWPWTPSTRPRCPGCRGSRRALWGRQHCQLTTPVTRRSGPQGSLEPGLINDWTIEIPFEDMDFIYILHNFPSPISVLIPNSMLSKKIFTVWGRSFLSWAQINCHWLVTNESKSSLGSSIQLFSQIFPNILDVTGRGSL